MTEEAPPVPDRSGFERMADGVFAELNKLRERRGREVLPGDQTDTGRPALRAQRAAPWIVMVKAAGTIEQPEENRRTTKGGEVYNVLYRAAQIVEVHIMGHNDHETELLWCDFLFALRLVMEGFALPTAFSWVSQEEGGSGHSHGGREKIVQLFTLTMDVPGDIEALTIIESEDHTEAFDALD